MKLDAATLEIIRNYFSAICCTMANIIERTSYSSYVTESADFATALAVPNGDFFAYPQSVGVSNFLGLSLARAIEYCGGNDAMNEGDIIITNDPYNTDGLSTHLPDVHLFKPIFYQEELICYTWAFVHTADIGGCVPSSLTPAATDIQMEGLRIPPVKLYQKGALNKDIQNIYLASSRQPQMMMGDLNGMLAAMKKGEEKILDAIYKFGLETVKEAANALLQLSEQRARMIFEKIPDGAYTFSDYLDDDVESGVPIRLVCTVRVEGSDITLDYSDCDPQTRTAFNLITNGSRHAYLYQGLLAHIISEDPYVPMNGGLTFPIHIIAPKGSIVNAEYPAAGGIRHPVSLRLYNAVLGALAQIIPDRLQAAGGGQAAIVTLSLPDESRGGAYAAVVVEPMGGGGGAQHGEDGNHAIDSAAAYLKNTPIECLEDRTDILVHRYELVPNTGGAGQYRGGMAIRLDFEPLRNGAIVGARGQERMHFGPWGLKGGKAGAVGQVFLDPDTDQETQIPKLKMRPIDCHQVISFRSAGGGGWGPADLRDDEAVRKDVQLGLLDVEHARIEYGVVLRNQTGRYEIDKEDTSKLRESMRSAREGNEELYDLGQDREQYECVWTPEASDALVAELRQYPISSRHNLKVRAHQYMEEHHIQPDPDSIHEFLHQ